MPDIYLEHPKHGQKVAHSVSEAQADKASGWVEFDPLDRMKPAQEPEPVVVVPPAALPAFMDASPVVPAVESVDPPKTKRLKA
jgi:hypothetical protein